LHKHLSIATSNENLELKFSTSINLLLNHSENYRMFLCGGKRGRHSFFARGGVKLKLRGRLLKRSEVQIYLFLIILKEGVFDNGIAKFIRLILK